MGAIQPNFIPPRDIRELRDLCRQNKNLIEDRVRVKNRITKTLRQAGITLDTCMSDIFGKSGHAIIEALIAGDDPKVAAEHAKGSLRSKIPLLVEAVRYKLSEHYRGVLSTYWRQLSFIEKELISLDAMIERRMQPYRKVITRLCTITGVGTKVARGVISEISVDMSSFETAKNLCSWAKVCPGNNSSGGKRKSGKNSKGNRYLRGYLGEAAWASVRTKGGMFRNLYLRQSARLGKKKTIVLIMNKMLRIMHTMLSLGVDYEDTYEETHHRSTKQASVRSTVRQLSNEDLVHELISRGAKNVVWTWDEDAQASPM
jgi:transposase